MKLQKQRDYSKTQYRFLNEGLKSLAQSSNIFVPDTSFLFNGLPHYHGINARISEKYGERPKGITNFSLIKLYLSFLKNSDSNLSLCDLKKVNDVVGKNLERSKKSLELLTEFDERLCLFIPETARNESKYMSGSRIKDLDSFVDTYKFLMEIGHTKDDFFNKDVFFKYNAETTKAFFREQYKNYIENFIELERVSLEQIKGFLKNESEEKSQQFEDNDMDIINSAMEQEGLVTILTCDAAFVSKANKVKSSRIILGKKIPPTNVVIVRNDLENYHISVIKPHKPGFNKSLS
jgi:hypothetical protein